MAELRTEAEAEAVRLRGQADAEADRIRNDAARQDPQFYAFLKKLEDYQRILGDNKSMLLLSTHRELFDMLFNPPSPGAAPPPRPLVAVRADDEGGREMKRRTLLFLSLLLVLAGLVYAATGVYQVLPGEVAVVRRFGRVLPERPEPGLCLGLPVGHGPRGPRGRGPAAERRGRLSGCRGRRGACRPANCSPATTTSSTCRRRSTTRCGRTRRRPTSLQAERVDGLTARAAETVMAEWVASRTVDETLLNGKVDLRAALLKQVQERIDPYGLGVEVLDAPVALIAPPDEVKSAFDDVAREQTRIETKVNNAEQEAESQWRIVLSYKYQKEQETAAYTENRRTLAERDAESFLNRLHKYQEARRDNPDYLRQIWDEERGKLFAKLKEDRQLGLLDDHIGPDGLDLDVLAPTPPKP